MFIRDVVGKCVQDSCFKTRESAESEVEGEKKEALRRPFDLQVRQHGQIRRHQP
jgi:hypothetical protein